MSERSTDTQYFNGLDWEESFGYSQAYRVSDTLYVSGQLAHDDQGNLVGAGDITAQARQTFANLDRVLAFFGADKTNVIRTDVFLVNLRNHFQGFSAEHAAYFAAHRPASTTVGVVEMAMPGQILEISVIAHLDRR